MPRRPPADRQWRLRSKYSIESQQPKRIPTTRPLRKALPAANEWRSLLLAVPSVLSAMLLRTRIITYGAEDEARKSVLQNAGENNRESLRNPRWQPGLAFCKCRGARQSETRECALATTARQISDRTDRKKLLCAYAYISKESARVKARTRRANRAADQAQGRRAAGSLHTSRRTP